MKPLDNHASDDDQHLETIEGTLIKLDTPKFLQWLEANKSFRFEAGYGGEDSYRARKETLRGSIYWYAVKKVNGKLHKKFIGKPGEVTHARLVEVSKLIRRPPTKQKESQQLTTDNSQLETATYSNELEERVTALEMLCNQLQQQLGELLNKPNTLVDDATTLAKSNLEDENKQLQAENQELTNKVNQLTEQVNELTNQVTNLIVNQDSKPTVNYQALRDKVVNGWKVAKRAETKDRIVLALDRFIAELASSNS